MNKLVFTLLLTLSAFSISAQTSQQSEEARIAELRQKIGIDYSMPDFNTSRINGKVIGKRLAKMLQKLQDQALDYVWSSRIAGIICEHSGKLQYAILEKFSIKNISKQGDVMTIKANAKLKKNIANIDKYEMIMVFDKGVSESIFVNDLFIDLNKYLKDY